MQTPKLKDRISPPTGGGQVTLDERIQISNAAGASSVEAAERFHRQTSLIRSSRFGLDITPYQESEIYKVTATRQTRLSGRIADLFENQSVPSGALRRRSSQRNFSPTSALSYELLRGLFLASFCPGSEAEPIPYPSAGAAYSVQVLLMPLIKIEGAPFLSDSILHLAGQERALYVMAESGAQQAATVCLDGILGSEPDSFINAAFIVAYVMDLEVATLRYAERGYRFALIEAGMMAQQASLVSQQLGLGSCILGGFPDAELSAALGLNPKKMLTCVAQVFGCHQPCLQEKVEKPSNEHF